MLDSEEYLQQVMEIRGVLGAALVDYASGLAVRAAGRVPGGDHRLAAAGVAGIVHAALGSVAVAAVARPGSLDDIVLTGRHGYHLLHFVPARPGSRLASLVGYVWLDRALGNLAMAQRQLARHTADLVAGSADAAAGVATVSG